MSFEATFVPEDGCGADPPPRVLLGGFPRLLRGKSFPDWLHKRRHPAEQKSKSYLIKSGTDRKALALWDLPVREWHQSRPTLVRNAAHNGP